MTKKTTTKHPKSYEQERADRLHVIKPAETMTVEELEIIENYRASTPKRRAAFLTLMRLADAMKGGA